jgi:hypothetical protein
LRTEPESDAHGNGHGNADAYRNADTKGYSNSAAAPDCSASAVRLGAIRSFLRELAKRFASSRKAATSLSQSASSQR